MKILIYLFNFMVFVGFCNAMYKGRKPIPEPIPEPIPDRPYIYYNHFTLSPDSRIYVVMENASEVQFGRLRHIPQSKIPRWVYGDEKKHVPEHVYVYLRHDIRGKDLVEDHLVAILENTGKPVEFRNNEKSHCFVVDAGNVYKADLYDRGFSHLSHLPLVHIKIDTDNPKWYHHYVGGLREWEDYIPEWMKNGSL